MNKFLSLVNLIITYVVFDLWFAILVSGEICPSYGNLYISSLYISLILIAIIICDYYVINATVLLDIAHLYSGYLPSTSRPLLFMAP